MLWEELQTVETLSEPPDVSAEVAVPSSPCPSMTPGETSSESPGPRRTTSVDAPAIECADPIEPLVVPETMRIVTALDIMCRRGLTHLVVRSERYPPRVVSEVGLWHRLAVSNPAERRWRLVEAVGLVARIVPHLPADTRRSTVARYLFAHDDEVAFLIDGGEPVALLSPRSVMRSVADGPALSSVD